MDHDGSFQVHHEQLSPDRRGAEVRGTLASRLKAHRFSALLVVLLVIGGLAPVIQEARG